MSGSGSYGGGGIATPVSIANGGTGQTTQTAAFDALAPTTTKGDVIVHNGSDNIRLAVGADGLVLTADSAQASGLAWSAAGSGDVTGPGSSTDNAAARFDGTGGKTLQNSLLIIDDVGAVSGATQLDVDNIQINGNTISSTDTNGNINLTPDGTGVIAGTELTLTTDLAITHGGTGASTATAAFDNLSPVTTKGDIIVRDASNNIRLAVGSDDLPLVADSAAGAGVSYKALPVAGGGSGRATATAYAVVCGGTTATGAHQSIASVGTSGQVLTSNGAGALPTFQTAASGFTPAIFCKDYYWMWADFIDSTNSPEGFSRYSSGGSGGFVSSEANHPGIYQLTTSSSSTGRSNMYNGQKGFQLGDGETTVEWCVNLKTALSDGTETYTFFCGIMDDGFTAAVTSANDLVGFRYTHTENSGNWTGVCKEDGTESTGDLGTAAAADTWIRLKIIVNAAATSCSFYINDVEGTNSPITTNIPDTSDEMIFLAGIVKSNGTTSRAVYLDYCEALIACSSERND